MSDAPPFKKTPLGEILADAAGQVRSEATSPQHLPQRPEEAEETADLPPVRMRPEIYMSFKAHVNAAFMLIFRHFADRAGVPAEHLTVDYDDDGDTVTMRFHARILRPNGRVSPGIYTAANHVFSLLFERMAEAGDEHCHFRASYQRARYSIQMDAPERIVPLLRAVMEHVGEQRIGCLDDLRGVRVMSGRDKENDIIGKTGEVDIWYLPGGPALSARNAFLLENEAQDSGTLPLSLLQLESLLLQATRPQDAPAAFSAEIQDYILH